jgi:hypothetical protein
VSPRKPTCMSIKHQYSKHAHAVPGASRSWSHRRGGRVSRPPEHAVESAPRAVPVLGPGDATPIQEVPEHQHVPRRPGNRGLRFAYNILDLTTSLKLASNETYRESGIILRSYPLGTLNVTAVRVISGCRVRGLWLRVQRVRF